MSEMLPNFDSEPDGEEPTVRIAAGNQNFVLAPSNTEFVTFEFGEGEYDHIIHNCPDGEPLVIFFRMDNAEGLKEILQRVGFESDGAEELDERTINFYTQIMSSRLPSSPAQLEEAS